MFVYTHKVFPRLCAQDTCELTGTHTVHTHRTCTPLPPTDQLCSSRSPPSSPALGPGSPKEQLALCSHTYLPASGQSRTLPSLHSLRHGKAVSRYHRQEHSQPITQTQGKQESWPPVGHHANSFKPFTCHRCSGVLWGALAGCGSKHAAGGSELTDTTARTGAKAASVQQLPETQGTD